MEERSEKEAPKRKTKGSDGIWCIRRGTARRRKKVGGKLRKTKPNPKTCLVYVLVFTREGTEHSPPELVGYKLQLVQHGNVHCETEGDLAVDSTVHHSLRLKGGNL